jgi:hypothetical protein
MKITEKKDRPAPIIKEMLKPVALLAIGSTIAKFNAEFSGITRLGSESIRLEMESIEAICEHFERLLSDERLLKRSRNHRAIKKLYGELMRQTVGEFDALLASEKAKRTAKKGGKAKAKKMKEQADAVKAYYLAHKDNYKNKDDAAFGIEGKKINNIQITVSVSTIRKYLKGL